MHAGERLDRVYVGVVYLHVADVVVDDVIVVEDGVIVRDACVRDGLFG